MQDKQTLIDTTMTNYDDQTLLGMIEGTIPAHIKDQLVEATVLEIGERSVLLDTSLKADGVISINEFKDTPQLKAGDKIEVYIERQKDANGNQIVSRKKAKKLRAWQTIEKAYHEQKPLLGKVEGRVKGGLEVSIDGITTFLPGSQIDTTPVTDFDALLNQSLEVMVLSIKPEKQNAVVSGRARIELAQKALIENLKEGQVLEGTIKNVTSFGVFVELAEGIVGLIYVKELVWDKKVNHPEQVKDAEGNPHFVVGESVKVVVKGFEEQENSSLPRIALSTKALLPNPWDSLPENLNEGAVITGHVTAIKERGICVQIQEGIEGFVHISEMSLSPYAQNPAELVSPGQELKLQILKLDREEQDLRLGMKQLIEDPWTTETFLEKYGLNTRHEAIVRKYGDKNKGAYLEIEPGVEGYLDNDHISWTKKILRTNDYLQVGDRHEVLVLGVNEEEKLLKLGMRELEDSPWDSFEKIFTIGSDHEAVVKQKYRSGTILELPYGLQTFVPNKELIKRDSAPIKEGDILPVRTLDFIKYEHKVIVSHVATYKESQEETPQNSSPQTTIHTVTKTTLSDLGTLSKLKEKLAEQTKEEKTKEKASEDNT